MFKKGEFNILKKNKFFSLFIALTLIVTGLSLNAIAAETSDSWWSNQYRVWSPYDHTPARKKTNKTAYYNITQDTNIGYHTIWAAMSDGTDVSSGRSYRSHTNTETFLYNLAVETYGKNCKVMVKSKAWHNGYSNGYWSPDSIR